VFRGNASDLQALRDAVRSDCPVIPHWVCEASRFVTSPEITRCHVAAAPNNKGVGPDGIPAELSKAGGSAIAVFYDALHQKGPQAWIPRRRKVVAFATFGN